MNIVASPAKFQRARSSVFIAGRITGFERYVWIVFVQKFYRDRYPIGFAWFFREKKLEFILETEKSCEPEIGRNGGKQNSSFLLENIKIYLKNAIGKRRNEFSLRSDDANSKKIVKKPESLAWTDRKCKTIHSHTQIYKRKVSFRNGIKKEKGWKDKTNLE